MVDREKILKQREEHMAQTSDARDKVEQLRSELRQIETRIDNLQKLRSELIARQIETQAFVGSSDLHEAF